MKWLKIVLIAVPVVILVVGLILFSRLDSIVRSTIESQSTAQLKVPTTLKSANVSLLGGKVGLKEYSIGSPQGFPAERMFQLDNIDVAVTYGQLTSTPTRIKSIDIVAPKLVLERHNLKLNVQALIDQLPKSDAPDDGETVRLIIDQLTVTNATVAVRPGIPGLKEEYTLTIPRLDMARIGTDESAQNGAAIKDVVIKVISALAAAAAQNEGLPPELRQVLAGDLKGLVDEKVKAVGDELRSAATQIADDPTKIKDVGKDLEKGLKDLIPGKKK